MIRALALASIVTVLPGAAACNLVVGIEPVSGTAQDEFAETCLAVINSARAAEGHEPLVRWLDNEACAASHAEALATTGMAEGLCGASFAATCLWSKGSNQTMLESCFGGDAFDAGDSKLACASYERGDNKVQIVAFLR